jgi:hypothetical protein
MALIGFYVTKAGSGKTARSFTAEHAGESIGRVSTVQGGESISVEFANAIGILTAPLSACYPCPLVFPHLRLLNGIDIKGKK